jgi:hypothetical protein
MEPECTDPEMALIMGGGPSAVSFSPEPELRQADYSLLDTAMTHEHMNDETLVIPGRFQASFLTKPNVNLSSF